MELLRCVRCCSEKPTDFLRSANSAVSGMLARRPTVAFELVSEESEKVRVVCVSGPRQTSRPVLVELCG